MRTDILTQGSGSEAFDYCLRKFKKMDSPFYPRKARDKKCILYYIAASMSNRGEVERAYQVAFKQFFPDGADLIEKQMQLKADKQQKKSSVEWREETTGKIEDGQQLLELLKDWKAGQKYQEGEAFFLELQSKIRDFDSTLCDPTEFRSEAEILRVAKLTGKMNKTAKEVSVEFEGMIGIRQTASIKFEHFNENWGVINAALEEEFKLGAWTSGSAKAKMEKLGFTLEAQAALAIGAQLNIDGNLTWRKGKAGLDLKGSGELFAGAEGALSGRLSANVRKGLEASFEAKAFAGFRAKVSGEAAFVYGEKSLVGIKAEAEVSFGVGGEISASFKAPIFGATQVSFTSSAAIGLGTGVSVETTVNCSEIYLAGAEKFREVVYWQMIARGYSQELMTQDFKNLYYLNKCINRISLEVEGMEERVRSFDKTKPEKQRLLM